jgi:hypothetical protein
VIVSVQSELAFLLLNHIIAVFWILGVEVRHLVPMGLLPRVTEEVRRAAHVVVKTLHFVLGESLLHAEADE